MSVHHERHEIRELHKKMESLIQKRLNFGFGAVVLVVLGILSAIVVSDYRFKTAALIPLGLAGYFSHLFFQVLPPQIQSFQSQIDQKSGR